MFPLGLNWPFSVERLCVWGDIPSYCPHALTHTYLSPHAEAKLSCSRLGTLKLLGLAACLTDSCQAEGGWIEARPHSILLLANHLWQHGLRFNTSNPHHAHHISSTPFVAPTASNTQGTSPANTESEFTFSSKWTSHTNPSSTTPSSVPRRRRKDPSSSP